LQRPWRRGEKVFWFFFSKKNFLFLLIFLIFGRLGSYKNQSFLLLFVHKKKFFLFVFFAETPQSPILRQAAPKSQM
jgi:hypothetical protein